MHQCTVTKCAILHLRHSTASTLAQPFATYMLTHATYLAAHTYRV
jgi:hypothetical protein